MKKTCLQIFTKIGSLLGWRWLYFLAGIGLISSIQSCKPVIKKCYSPVRVDDEVNQTKCYDKVEPIDSARIIEEAQDSLDTE